MCLFDRVKPGCCYHLYNSLRDSLLDDYQLPEIARTPLEELCLQIKVWMCSTFSFVTSCVKVSATNQSVLLPIQIVKLGGIGFFLRKLLDPPSQQAVCLAINHLMELVCAIYGWQCKTVWQLGYIFSPSILYWGLNVFNCTSQDTKLKYSWLLGLSCHLQIDGHWPKKMHLRGFCLLFYTPNRTEMVGCFLKRPLQPTSHVGLYPGHACKSGVKVQGGDTPGGELSSQRLAGHAHCDEDWALWPCYWTGEFFWTLKLVAVFSPSVLVHLGCF